MNDCLSLYVYGVWIGVVICEVWMKIEKIMGVGEK